MPELITPYTISVSALLISLLSLLFQEFQWRRSTRPIVSAYLCNTFPNEKISSSVDLNLIIINTGTMPATDIRIRAKESDIKKIFGDEINEVDKDIVTNCFDNKRTTPLLLNGNKAETFFGHCEQINATSWKGLKYDSWLPIKITYRDLNKRKYRTSIKLKLRDSYGFGGAVAELTKTSSSFPSI